MWEEKNNYPTAKSTLSTMETTGDRNLKQMPSLLKNDFIFYGIFFSPDDCITNIRVIGKYSYNKYTTNWIYTFYIFKNIYYLFLFDNILQAKSTCNKYRYATGSQAVVHIPQGYILSCSEVHEK